MSSAKNRFRALPSTYALPNPTVDRASYRYARVALLARECTVQALFSTGITLDEMPKRSNPRDTIITIITV